MISSKSSIVFIMMVFLIAACTTSEDVLSIEEDEHFNIKFELDQRQSHQYNLTFIVQLDSGYYYVSPHSNGQHQRLIFSIEDTDSLSLNDSLLETPRTMVEYDDLSKKEGRFVRETSKYYQNLTVNTENNFEVEGLIWFELRPVCQAYEVGFVISNDSGKLAVNKSVATISTAPTFWDKKRADAKGTNEGAIY